MATDMTKFDQYFQREPTKEEDAWGIVHDVSNILLHYIQDANVKVSASFDDELEKLSPNSTVQEVANLFHRVGLNPVWAVWWTKSEEQQ